MDQRGMTLIEVVMAVAILSVVMAVLMGLAIGLGDTARVQDIKITTNDEARRALQVIIPQVRQASRGSINWNELPGERLSFRIATDTSNNGFAVNVSGNIELSPVRVIQRDIDDLTGDGFTLSQLVLIDGEETRVLANDIVPISETLAEDGTFGPDQDINNNGRLDRGFWVQPRDGGLEITVEAQGETRQGHIITTTLTEFVVPRN